MSAVDLIIHAGTRFALEQWLQARGLGENVQDTDPDSPTFGDYQYTHTDPDSKFLYWRHASGQMERTWDEDNSDPENPTLTVTYYSGFYGILRFATREAFESSLADWLRNNTAISILEGFNGIGGEGVTIVDASDVQAHLDNIGAPQHEWLGLGVWSDPTMWYASPVMTGDQREFDGTLYESLIDFNVWTVDQAPQTWAEVEVDTSQWAAGVSYSIGDVVGYEGADYRCLQAHTSLTGWEPPNVPALWELV